MVAIITGGTKGIGRAVCDIMLQNGMDISLCSRNSDDLANIKSEYKKQYPNQKIHTSKVDMSQKEDVLRYASEVKSEFDSIEILVNNAGVFIPGQIISEEEGSLSKMIETNLYSAYHLTRALMPHMMQKKKGHIFNMCSIASFMAYPNGGSYAISKFALLGFSKCIREELKEHGIRVTAVMPGATWSDSWKGVDLPLDRLMKPEDVAKSIWSAYDLSDASVVEEIILRPQLGDL